MRYSDKAAMWLFIILLTGLVSPINAQNKLVVNSDKPVFFDLKSLYRAGLSGEIEATGIHWLRYTTNVEKQSPPIAITVQIGGGRVPEGMKLIAEAGSYKGLSAKGAGNSAGRISVSDAPKVIIENIRQFHPEKGIDQGHPIRFSFEITDYSKIEPGKVSIYLLYTIIQ